MANEKQVTGYSAMLTIRRNTREELTGTYRDGGKKNYEYGIEELIEVNVRADDETELRGKLQQLVDTALPQREVDVKSEGDMYRG